MLSFSSTEINKLLSKVLPQIRCQITAQVATAQVARDRSKALAILSDTTIDGFPDIELSNCKWFCKTHVSRAEGPAVGVKVLGFHKLFLSYFWYFPNQ